MAKKAIPVISLFSGAMGLDLGFEAAGFRIAVAVECNKVAAETILLNRPDLPLLEDRLENVSTEELLKAGDISPGDDVVVIGGPSCQAFSTAGQRRSLGDPRGGMFREFIRVVREADARFFVMENVKGLMSAAVNHRPLRERGPGFPHLTPEEELGSAFRLIVHELQDLGYYTIFDLLNAADYGVPQVRKRLVFIGSRNGEYVRMPAPTHNVDGTDGLKKWVTFGEAVKDLNEEEPIYYRTCPSKEKYLKLIPPGGNWRDLPDNLKKAALGSAYESWGGRSGFFRRLAWDKPSPAVTTRPDSKATMLAHPTELRPLTVGEYARLQQFPDDWVFAGSPRQMYPQVGNAVPLGLGTAIARAVKKAIRSRKFLGRHGTVECHNVGLLKSMAIRPRIVVNPPRMRKDGSQEALVKWLNGRERLRSDVLEFAAPEAAKELRQLLGPREQRDARDSNGSKVVRQREPSKVKGACRDGNEAPCQ